MSSVIVGDLGNVVGLDLLISRSGHLEPRGKIRPQLESVHPSGSVALGHFLVNDAASGCHPLHIARRDGSVIPHAVAMFDRPGEHIRYRLNATVGMPGKSGKIVFGNIVAKVVQQQKRIKLARVAETKCAPEMNSCSFERGFGFDKPLNRPNGHAILHCPLTRWATLF